MGTILLVATGAAIYLLGYSIGHSNGAQRMKEVMTRTQFYEQVLRAERHDRA